MLIHKLSGCRRREGLLYGVEVELEFEEYHPDQWDNVPEGWMSHRDGSLADGIELVSVPSSLGSLKGLIEVNLDKYLKEYNPIQESPRTSVHVHINCSDVTFEKAITRACAFWVYEQVFINEYCSDSRRGNLFCLSVSEADLIFDEIKRVTESGVLDWREGQLKYSGLNLYPLRSIGTIEVRVMHGLTTAYEIMSWVETLDKLMKWADTYRNPRELIQAVLSDPEAVRTKVGLGGSSGLLWDGADNLRRLCPLNLKILRKPRINPEYDESYDFVESDETQEVFNLERDT